MQFRKAKLTDLETIIEILSDGKDQLAEKGIDQWQGDYPSRDQVIDDIKKGHAFLAQSNDGETVGTFAIVNAPDNSYETMHGNWLVDTDDYVTIHRVAIHSNHGGKGYATQLFKAIINHLATHHANIQSIRIDTHVDNLAMQHLIDKMGFEKVGEMYGAYHQTDAVYVYELLTKKFAESKVSQNHG